MANTIQVNRNKLKLLSRQFLVIHDPKEFTVRPDVLYRCATPEELDLGMIQVSAMHEVQLYDLRTTVMLLADGDAMSKERMKALGLFNTTTLQICTFHFIQRKVGAFKSLLDRELKGAGIDIPHQQSIF